MTARTGRGLVERPAEEVATEAQGVKEHRLQRLDAAGDTGRVMGTSTHWLLAPVVWQRGWPRHRGSKSRAPLRMPRAHGRWFGRAGGRRKGTRVLPTGSVQPELAGYLNRRETSSGILQTSRRRRALCRDAPPTAANRHWIRFAAALVLFELELRLRLRRRAPHEVRSIGPLAGDGGAWCCRSTS